MEKEPTGEVFMNKRTSILALAVLAGLLPATARADVLQQKLYDKMPEILKKLEEKGYKVGSNVGVLRFRVQRGSGKATFKAPLCGSLADRVENLLVIRNPGADKNPMGVIHDAGVVATKNKIDSWFSKPEARQKLFELQYPLAWGKPPARVKPDVFLTGLLKTTSNMRNSTLTVQYFDSKSTDLVDLATITFKSDRNIARGFGYSFAIPAKARQQLVAKRSAKGEDVDDLAFEDLPKQDQQDKKQQRKDDDPEKKEQKKQDEPEKKQQRTPTRTQKQDTPKNPKSVGGIQVQMLVDDNPIQIRPATDGGPIAWQLTSPAPGQKVTFRLRNNSARQLGVVLRLNGVSTYEQQTGEPEKCQKWVIDPGKTAPIDGFMMPGEGEKMQVRPIKVLVGEDARKAREAYGDKAGLIEVDVYEEGNEEQPLMVSSKGLPPSKERKMRESYVSLRDAMIKSAGLKRSMVEKRELLVPDEESTKEAKVTEVPFNKPLLVAHLAIKVVPAGGVAGGDDDVPVED
jgi:hypothetical protein